MDFDTVMAGRRQHGKRSRRWQAALCALLLLGMSALVMAMPTDIILVLDNSGSMRKNDPEFLLKRAVSGFVNGLDADTHVGMVVFDEKITYPVPLATLDVDSRARIQAALDAIDYRGQRTDSPGAIERAIYELKDKGRKDVPRIIVFMTDGIVDTGNADVDTEKTKWMREELATDAADSDIRIFGVAFTENADFFLIQSLAKRTNGAYFRALKPEDLAGVFSSIKDELAQPPQPEPAPPQAPPAPTPAPAQPAQPAAAGGSCLDSVVPEERAAMEEAAPDAGMSAEEFCRQLTGGSGNVVVVPPKADAPVAAPAPADDKLGMIVVIGLAVLVLLLVGLVVMLLLRRRGGGASGSAAAPVASAAVIPDAFLKDINGITDEPAVKLGEKPLMIGRVAGSDPQHIEYYVINKGTVGRRHALIQYRDFCFWLSDQGSVNGTFLNGERIDHERQLKHGDHIKFHKYEFEFSMPELEDAGHTVFADPSQATMIGEATIVAGSTAAVAAQVAPPRSPAPPAPSAADDFDNDAFDITGEGEAEAAPAAAMEAPGSVDDFDDEAPTELPLRAAPPDDDNDFDKPALAADDADDFDAEASAFFDEDDLGVALSSADVDEPPPDDEDDEQPTVMSAPAAEAAPAPPAAPAATPPDDFAEGETLVPGAPYADDTLSMTSSDISLDEFMRTDSFDAPIFGRDEDDAEDATLMPDAVDAAPVSAPVIEDVFDITGDRTVPPVGRNDDDDDGDEDDGSEAPTVFRR